MAADAHESQARTEHWTGAPGTTGTVAVIGLGKIGVPLAARYTAAGWNVIGVDVLPEVVDSFGAGRSHIAEEPGVAELLADGHAAGRVTATASHADAASRADVVVMIVPLMLTDQHLPDYAWMDAATQAMARGLRPGTLVTYETTLPVGDTRDRYGPLLQEASGLSLQGEDRFYLAFSPERVFSGRILDDLSAYPKLVGGVDRPSTERAMAFYQSVLDAEIWDLGTCETAEFAKLAETTYRDVNIALANEFARYADDVGVDISQVIRGANSQPYSHIHQPGIGVGGHCIPVYPYFLLAREPGLSITSESRRINDGQVERAVVALEERLGSLDGVSVLVLGLTYREGVHEMAYSRGPALVSALVTRGARVLGYDPLLSDAEIRQTGAEPYRWGDETDARVIVTQTADPLWQEVDPAWFPELEVVYDGRNSLREVFLPGGVRYVAVGHAGDR